MTIAEDGPMDAGLCEIAGSGVVLLGRRLPRYLNLIEFLPVGAFGGDAHTVRPGVVEITNQIPAREEGEKPFKGGAIRPVATAVGDREDV
jgi:hypothetical protein